MKAVVATLLMVGSAAAVKDCNVLSKRDCNRRGIQWKPSHQCKWVYISGEAQCVKASRVILESEETACSAIKSKKFCQSRTGRCIYKKILGVKRCVNDKSWDGDLVTAPPNITPPPTKERVPCSEIDGYKKVANRKLYCERRHDCVYTPTKRCVDTGPTGSPTTAPPTATDPPTEAPACSQNGGSASCADIDGYKLENRKFYCDRRCDCVLDGSSRCRKVTASPTPATPTDAPTQAPTCKNGGSATCATLNTYQPNNKKTYCSVRCDCAYFEAENLCLDAGETPPDGPATTDSPTAATTDSPTVATTDTPTTSGVTYPTCSDHDAPTSVQSEVQAKKTACLATEGCEFNAALNANPDKLCTNARTTKEFCNQFHAQEDKCTVYGCNYKENTNCGCGGAYC